MFEKTSKHRSEDIARAKPLGKEVNVLEQRMSTFKFLRGLWKTLLEPKEEERLRRNMKRDK